MIPNHVRVRSQLLEGAIFLDLCQSCIASLLYNLPLVPGHRLGVLGFVIQEGQEMDCQWLGAAGIALSVYASLVIV